ncbi:hypothetical protein C8R44DRAFT_754337 [Mycena epipterygia]|nr:hypothetical protein C8R44DRAFT_754337 [Mycena epipterygia]
MTTGQSDPDWEIPQQLGHPTPTGTSHADRGIPCQLGHPMPTGTSHTNWDIQRRQGHPTPTGTSHADRGIQRRHESTPIYAPDGTLQGLLLIPETSDTDRTLFYAPDGTLHGAAWRRLTVADMVDMFIPAPEPVAVVWTYLANDPALSSLPMPSSTVNYELNFVSTLGPRAEAVRLAGDGIDLKSAKLGRSQFNIGFLDLESASKGHQTRK